MTPAEAAAALRELGTTPDAVAEALRARGIQGEPDECGLCPVAQYLRSLDPEIWVSVEPEGGVWVTTLDNLDDPEFVEDVDQCVLDFAKHFDEGRFPFLELGQPMRDIPWVTK